MNFKCSACGYEYEENWNHMREEIIKGDQKFIRIKGSFHIENDYYGGEQRVNLIACPKCSAIFLFD